MNGYSLAEYAVLWRIREKFLHGLSHISEVSKTPGIRLKDYDIRNGDRTARLRVGLSSIMESLSSHI